MPKILKKNFDLRAIRLNSDGSFCKIYHGFLKEILNIYSQNIKSNKKPLVFYMPAAIVIPKIKMEVFLCQKYL